MSYSLTTLSPLDGRYRAEVAALEAYFSEAALFRYRARVEIEYLIFLTRARDITFVPKLSVQAAAELRGLYRAFSMEDAAAIAAWDRQVNHDVKAVEYWLRERMDQLGLGAWKEAIHFALTSEDVNNLAYALMLREARDLVLLPALGELGAALHELALREAATPMPARTHGQPATPTTLGKEVAVFLARLRRAHSGLAAIKLTGKLNGASGTLAAHTAALPNVDWPMFSRAFIRFLDLDPIELTTQIEPHDTLAELCDALKRLNTVLIDLSQDVWRYISDGYNETTHVWSYSMELDVTALSAANGTSLARRSDTIHRAKLFLVAMAHNMALISGNRFQLRVAFVGLPSQLGLAGTRLNATTTYAYSAASALLASYKAQLIDVGSMCSNTGI